MASTDARTIPQKNVAYRVTFPIFDVDGDLVTAAASLDSEVSKDGGTFADCTNEATEIATSSGMYFLDLTSTEMNADTVAIIVKTTTADAKTVPIVLYPEEAGDIRVNLTQILGTAVATPATAGILDVNVKNIDNDAASASGTVTFPNATLASTTNITAGTLTTVTTATNVTTVNGLAAAVITAASIAADAITDAKVASDVTIASVTGAVGSVTGNVGGNVIGTVASVAGSVGSVTGLTASDVGSIKTKTDSLTFTVAGKVDANPTAINGDATSAASLAKTTRAIGRGTVTAAASTTSIPTSAFTPAGAVADQFKGRIITFDSDTTSTALRGQSTDITASSNAAAPTFTCTALTTAPASGDTFSVT